MRQLVEGEEDPSLVPLEENVYGSDGPLVQGNPTLASIYEQPQPDAGMMMQPPPQMPPQQKRLPPRAARKLQR